MDSSQQERLFEQWLLECKGLILKIVRAYAFTKQDQEDLFQEILVQLWRSIPSFQEKSKPSTWIYKVALNRSLTWQRSARQRDSRRVPFVEIEEPINEDHFEKRERLKFLYEEIRKLNKIDRCLTLLFLDDLNYREMAEIMEMSESNIGVRLNRIKKNLAEAMKGK